MQYGIVIWWLLALLAFMAVGMPLASALFPRLADRGAGLALPLAMAVLWLVAYLVGHVSLTVGLWAGLAILIGLSGLAVYRGIVVDRRRYAEVAVVFSIAFALMVAIRAVDAGIHPFMGEKFLDYGLMKSVLRADALPPEDMWFAGRPVKYYYGGHLLAALLTRITGTEPRFAYNLALAGFYAMFVTAGYGLAGSIAASRQLSRVRAGIFGAFFVGVASNITTPARFLLWVLPDGVSKGLAGALGFELKRVGAGGPDAFHYWTASRVIEGTINEFPLFAWMNGDMHAHMMSTPFVLLAAGLLFSYYRTPQSELWRRRALLFGTVPPMAALLAVVNTWSFATVGGLAFLTLALSPADPVSLLPDRVSEWVGRRSPLGQEVSRHAIALAGAGVVIGLGILWSLPFWVGAAQASQRSLGILPDRSSMGELLATHGAFVVIFLLYLLRHSLPHVDRDHALEAAVMLGFGVLLVWGGSSAAGLALFGPMIVVSWLLLRMQADTLAQAASRTIDAVPAVSDGGTVARDGAASTGPTSDVGDTDGVAGRLRDSVGFETVLFIAGAGLVVIVEFLYVKEKAGPGRFNTVFKTYADVWALWAVAAAAMLAHLVENRSPYLALTQGRWRTVTRILAVVLVVSTGMYGAFALSGHFTEGGYSNPRAHPQDPTLDGLRWVQQERPNAYQAILYVDSLEGTPNMVSEPHRMYQWSSPISSLTGVPTLAGWRHEVGYRGRGPYTTRADDVETIYSGNPKQRAYLLDVYEVEYIYVGANERDAYSRADLRAFRSMEGVTLSKRWGSIYLYEVDQSKLSYPGKSGSN